MVVTLSRERYLEIIEDCLRNVELDYCQGMSDDEIWKVAVNAGLEELSEDAAGNLLSGFIAAVIELFHERRRKNE